MNSSAAAQDRQASAVEYLFSMRALSDEIEKAMQAIAHSALVDFEESVTNQRALSIHLCRLAEELSIGLEGDVSLPAAPIAGDLVNNIHDAFTLLQKLNRRYAALLRHSNRCTGQMISLCQTYSSTFQEASGAGLKHQTWSCRM